MFNCTKCGEQLQFETRERGNTKFQYRYYIISRILGGCGCKRITIKEMFNRHKLSRFPKSSDYREVGHYVT